MAMHALQNESTTSDNAHAPCCDAAFEQPVAVDHPVLQRLMADQAAAFTDEVRSLRNRVAELEAELAAARAALATSSAPTTNTVAATAFAGELQSEFSDQQAPAVVAVPTEGTGADDALVQPSVTHKSHAAGQVDLVPDPGFAQAWDSDQAETASFEERLAERAFFEATAVDQDSRSWLLAE